MVTDRLPFQSCNKQAIINNIIEKEIDFKDQIWTGVSLHVQDLVKKMLCKNPAERPSV